MNCEDFWVSQIDTLWPVGLDPDAVAADRALKLAESALREFPESSILWQIRGELLQLSNQYDRSTVVQSFERSIALDSKNAEAHESYASFLDAAVEDFPKAEMHYRVALALGGGCDTYVGLALVLAEQGKTEEALAALAPERCPFAYTTEVNQIKNEIEQGQWSPIKGT